jgi:hypothetical protein
MPRASTLIPAKLVNSCRLILSPWVY